MKGRPAFIDTKNQSLTLFDRTAGNLEIEPNLNKQVHWLRPENQQYRKNRETIPLRQQLLSASHAAAARICEKRRVYDGRGLA